MHEDPTRRMPAAGGGGYGEGPEQGMPAGQKAAMGLLAAVALGLLIAVIFLAANGGTEGETTTETTTAEETTTTTVEQPTTSTVTETTTETTTETETIEGDGSGGLAP